MTTEFAHLADEAAALGLPEPSRPVTRRDLGALSALVWGNEPDVVLLHGAGLNAHTWDATLLALDRDAVALDLPGHGDSAWRDDGDYRAATNAAAIAPVFDALTDAPDTTHAASATSTATRGVLLVGHSLGGMTAIALAADPRVTPRIRGLVLVDVSPGIQPVDASQVRDFLAGATSFGSRDEIVDRAIAAGIGSDRRALERGVLLNTRVREDGSVVFKHHLVSLPADAPDVAGGFADLWEPLVSLQIPVMLVRGTDGYLSDAVVDGFRDRLPSASVIEITSGHNVQEQQPVALAAAIQAFDTSADYAA